MRILITSPDLKDPGGVASYYNSILPYLYEDKDINITIFEIGSSDAKFSLLHPVLDQLRFIKIILFKKFDIIHINPSLNFKSFIRDGLFIFWAKRKSLPVIIFIHGWKDSFYDKISGLLTFFFNKTYKKADRFIVLASDFKSKLISKDITQPIHILTTSVDNSLVRNFSIENKIEKIHNSSIIKILFLSRIEKEKGIFETIDAFKILFEHGYNVSLSIAGDGNATKEVRDYIAENDLQSNVYMVGYVRGEEKQKMFKDHDIYCFPTYYGEGMPNSVLEAMAFGMPVVTRPIGGIKDFFQNGYMGYLSESTQPEEIAECIKKIINNKKILCNIALYNHSFAIKNFMASKVARKLINEYEDLHAVQKGN